jgi:hypothetical protein
MIYFDLEVSNLGLVVSTEWIYLEFNWLSIATALVVVVGVKLWRGRK